MKTVLDPRAKVGLRVRIIKMNDPYPVDEGMEGTIYSIDDIGTLHVKWDDGGMLGVVPGEDEYQLLPALEDQIGFDIFESDQIKGGKADKLSIKDIAKKHKVSVEDIKKEIELGKEIEKEHVGSDLLKAKEIAMDHISEFPDYYSNKKYGVNAVEKKLKKLHESDFDGFKTHLQKIVDSIKTAKFIHKESIEKMIDNFYNKYKYNVSDVDKFNEIYTNLKDSLNKKFDIDETTGAAGGMSTGSFVGPLETKKESFIMTGRDFLKEYTTTSNTDRTTGNSRGNDKDTWASKSDGWKWNDKSVWDGGEVVDELSDLTTVWDDGTLDISNEWDRKQNKKLKESKKDVTTLSGETENTIEETTTFNSVFGSGFPVGPAFAAKKGDWKSAKKPIWKGGTILQKEEDSNEMVLRPIDEVNKVKFVKNGKYVKIKDKCGKYNNGPHCSQGSIDKPLKLSNKTFENVSEISKRLGISESDILLRVKNFLNK